MARKLAQTGRYAAVCASGLVTVCIEPQNGETEVFVVDPIADRDEVYRRAVKMAIEPSTEV